MNILALDTCTEMCSAAVIKDGALFFEQAITPRGHSDMILGMIETVLKQSGLRLNQIDALAFGRGPGSFTGVRVGVGVTQGIAFAHQIPVIPISTLAATAQRAIDEYQAENIAVALDARMGEVYAAHFAAQEGLAVACSDEVVVQPNQFLPLSETSTFAAGTGWKEHGAVLNATFNDLVTEIDDSLLPTAAVMAMLAIPAYEAGQTLRADQAVPVYLRDNVAKKKGEQ
jgi:tRNA threonylcarbamoyladenosine biosynthesis protein TsaB